MKFKKYFLTTVAALGLSILAYAAPSAITAPQTTSGSATSGEYFSQATLSNATKQFENTFYVSGSSITINSTASQYSKVAIQPYFATNFSYLAQNLGDNDFLEFLNVQDVACNLMVFAMNAYQDLQKGTITQGQFNQILQNCNTASATVDNLNDLLYQMLVTTDGLQVVNSPQGKSLNFTINNTQYSASYDIIDQQKNVLTLAKQAFTAKNPQEFYSMMQQFALQVQKNRLFYTSGKESSMSTVKLSQYTSSWITNNLTFPPDYLLSVLGQQCHYLQTSNSYPTQPIPKNINQLSSATQILFYYANTEHYNKVPYNIFLVSSLVCNMTEPNLASSLLLEFKNGLQGNISLKVQQDFANKLITQQQYNFLMQTLNNAMIPMMNAYILNSSQLHYLLTTQDSNGMVKQGKNTFPGYIINLGDALFMQGYLAMQNSSNQSDENIKVLGMYFKVFNAVYMNYGNKNGNNPINLESYSGLTPATFKAEWFSKFVGENYDKVIEEISQAMQEETP